RPCVHLVSDPTGALLAFLECPPEWRNCNLDRCVPQGSEHPETPSSYSGDDDCPHQYVDQHPGHA
ncbi:MAG: hypothetical protein ACK559_32810, partial [bacterium]